MYPALSNFLIHNWPDILALVTGILGVWLTIKQHILCWLFASLSVLFSFFIFYQQRLFGDMFLQGLYFFLGIYGWLYWKQNLKTEFKVTKTDKRLIRVLITVTVLQAIAYYYLLNYLGGDRAFLDALLTAASITATYMMTKKWVENWAVWVVVDGTYILLYGLKHMWLFCLLYLLFTIMAYIGWLKWKKAAA
jgi:nicotinamide mononucleotide transporter